MKNLVRLAAMALGLFAGGCAELGVVEADPQAEWKARQAALDTVPRWEAQGRLALRLPDDSLTANIRWRQKGSAFNIRLSGPLGQGVGNLEGTPGQVTYESAKGETLRAASAEALLERELGWQLPVSGLSHWLTGRPVPGVPVDSFEVDDTGRLRKLSQLGWDLSYTQYAETSRMEMPSRLSLVRPGLKAKVLVTEWEVR